MLITTEQLTMDDSESIFVVPDYCFYCGKKLAEVPLVMWHGGGLEVWMHCECARKLAIHLMSDTGKALTHGR